MTNKNTIINGLKNQIHDLRTYADDGEVITLTVDQAENIVSLLEKQEAKQIKFYWEDEWYAIVYECPDCEAKWMSGSISETHFCPNCGRPVKAE